MNSRQLPAQEMAEIQIQAVHLRGRANKAGMRLGEMVRGVNVTEACHGCRLEIAMGGRVAGTGLQRRKPEQPADKPNGALAPRLPGGPATTPFVTERRQRRLVKTGLRQEGADGLIKIIRLAFGKRDAATRRAFGQTGQNRRSTVLILTKSRGKD